MRTIKVYCFPSHQTKERTSGVDFVRVIQPMKYLDGYSDGEVKFKVSFYDINKEPQDSWDKIAKEHDLVFMSYTVHDWAFAGMGVCMRNEGKKIVMDLDDAVGYLAKDNIVYDQMKQLSGAELINCMLQEVDGITTTNRYLENIIISDVKGGINKTAVMPNQIDLSLYNHVSPAKDTNTITLMHYGSTSHFNDQLDKEFVKGMDRIFKEYPNVKFKAVGSFISELRYKWGQRYEQSYGDVDLYKWVKEKFPGFMEEADIMVVPLLDNTYNRAKSDLKTIESGSAGKPVVCSAVRPYNDTIIHGKTGFLCKTSGDWYNSLKLLIDSKQKRQEIGENLYNYVKSERQIQNHVKEYADFFLKVLASK